MGRRARPMRESEVSCQIRHALPELRSSCRCQWAKCSIARWIVFDKTASLLAHHLCLPLDGLQSACKDTASDMERKTGREPATACLEGRQLRSRRSLDLYRPYSGFHTIHLHCERAWQKMSRAFFVPLGKTCHVFLSLFLAKDVAHISRQNVTLLNTLYLLSSSLAMFSRK